MTSIEKLRTFLELFQDPDGKFISENCVKATAEYLLVHRLTKGFDQKDLADCSGNSKTHCFFLRNF